MSAITLGFQFIGFLTSCISCNPFGIIQGIMGLGTAIYNIVTQAITGRWAFDPVASGVIGGLDDGGCDSINCYDNINYGFVCAKEDEDTHSFSENCGDLDNVSGNYYVNESSDTINGDSIVGMAPIVKNGNGNVTINNINRTGKTEINAGKLTVASFSNSVGNDFGSLGYLKNIITIADGATLAVSQTTACGQMLKVGSGTAKLEVASGKTLTLEQGLKQAGGMTVNKTGSGTLNLTTGHR